MNIRWSELFNTGITEIDNQHKALLRILNKALNVKLCTQKDDIELILSELKSYAKFHFTYEENLFEKYNFPNSGTHIKEHQEFKKIIEEFCLTINTLSSNQEYVEKLIIFLKDWLINHILNSERKYINYLPKEEPK